MKRGYNELVGIRATFSRAVSRFSLTHHYRWRSDGKKERTGTLRSFDMHRHIPISEILRNLAEAYEPVVISIWRQVTDAHFDNYLQFDVTATPRDVGLAGDWHRLVER